MCGSICVVVCMISFFIFYIVLVSCGQLQPAGSGPGVGLGGGMDWEGE